MWLDIALIAAIAAAGIIAVSFREPGSGPAWMLFPIGMLCFLSGRRFSLPATAKAALTWGALFLILIAGYTYRFELGIAAARLLPTWSWEAVRGLMKAGEQRELIEEIQRLPGLEVML